MLFIHPPKFTLSSFSPFPFLPSIICSSIPSFLSFHGGRHPSSILSLFFPGLHNLFFHPFFPFLAHSGLQPFSVLSSSFLTLVIFLSILSLPPLSGLPSLFLLFPVLASRTHLSLFPIFFFFPPPLVYHCLSPPLFTHALLLR